MHTKQVLNVINQARQELAILRPDEALSRIDSALLDLQEKLLDEKPRDIDLDSDDAQIILAHGLGVEITRTHNISILRAILLHEPLSSVINALTTAENVLAKDKAGAVYVVLKVVP